MDVEKTSLFGDADQHGKLWMKLKLPKEEGDDDHHVFVEDHHQKMKMKDDEVIFPRICQLCNKRFKSGKALGGHMRVHFQTHKDPSFIKKQKKEKSPADRKRLDFFAGGEDDDQNDPTNKCSECGKNFPSPKSLFGHMRCHPDRDWRGIRPPLGFSPSSSVVSDDGGGYEAAVESFSGGDLDLVSSLVNWSVTGKRGRKSLKKVDEDDDEKKMHAAVEHLLSLAAGNWDSKKINGDSSDDSEKTHDDHDQEQNQMNLIQKGKRRAKKKMKLRDLDHGVHNDVQKYKCTTCDRTFPTHQALGGHRSSHNKFRMLLQAEDDDDDDEDDDIVGFTQHQDGNQEEGVGSNSNYSHVCKVCNKNFPSGQALGGHKRCHKMNNGIKQSGRVLEFDLNEEPPMEFDQFADDDDDQIVAASCSYNSVEYPFFAR